MKAVVYKNFGSPDELKLTEVKKPVPKNDEVLVKVKASSVNSWDWDMVRGKPLPYRLLFGLIKPRYPIVGSDVSGIVEATGKDVKHLKAGDEVFGDISGNGFGAFAEYVCAKEDYLAIKPRKMSFEEAASIPQAGVLALQGLRKYGEVGKGQQLLINGAGGGVGTFAIQLAKLWGAEVTAVDHTQKMDFLKAHGADFTIDYTKENYTKNGQKYNIILDVIANHSVYDYEKVLKPNGAFVMIGGKVGGIIQTVLLGKRVGKKENKKIGVLEHRPNKQDLNYLAELYESGKMIPVIDKCFPLESTAEAVRYLGEGKAMGKVVVKC